MRYEVWGLHPANLIGTFTNEGEALDEVRGLLDAGWEPEDLSLGQMNGSMGVSVFEGEALIELLQSGGTSPATRSA